MLVTNKTIGLFSNLIDWLKEHSRPCFYKKNFGFECPGCGFQRAVIELLQGNIIESIKNYPALIPLILTFTMLLLHLVFRLKNGALIIKILFFISVSLIIGNFVIKLIL